MLQNRQSAARSRQRKKEYIGSLERKAQETEAENNFLKQQLYSQEQRVRVLEQRLTILAKQNDELQNLLKASNKGDDLQRILSIYAALPIPSPDMNPKQSTLSDQALLQAHLQQQQRHQQAMAMAPVRYPSRQSAKIEDSMKNSGLRLDQ